MPIKTFPLEEPALNLTSMIDVFILLIIFFMAATKFSAMERQIELQVPGVAEPAALTEAPDPKVVNVYKDGEVTLGGAAVTLEELTKRLAAARTQYQGVGVLIRGDQEATHGRMTEVYNACKRAGVAELAISVRLDTTKR